MIDDLAQHQARRIWSLTVMFCVAVVVLTADAISKAQVLARLPGHPPVRLLDGLITLDLTFNAGAAFGVGTSYTAVIALIVCGVIVSIIRTARRLRSLSWTIALGLLLGGATWATGCSARRGRSAARWWTGSTCRTSRGRLTWPTRRSPAPPC
jgi:Signal peptidase (SPase) II